MSGGDLLGTYNASGVNGNTGANPLETLAVAPQSLNRNGGSLPGGSDLQVSGDIFVYGKIFQDCGQFPATSATNCYDLPLTGNPGTTITQPTSHGNVAMFPTRQTLPSVDDLGTAHLSGGRAYVRIDPAFAATMDASSRYMVFVTPAGQSHGVYVANRTPSGFEVAENDGGRSSLDFDYRIVARPMGDKSARLAVVQAPRKLGALSQAYGQTNRAPLKVARKRAPELNPAFVNARLFAKTLVR